MTPRKTLDAQSSKRALPKVAPADNYDDEMPESLVDRLRERFGERLDAAKPVSEASW